MKLIKRWSTGLVSRVDWMVTQVENQEALVSSALRSAREATARAKVQLGRVRKDGDQLRQTIQTEEDAVTRWRERAVTMANGDEMQAMECLRRGKRAEGALKELRQRLVVHGQSEQQLTKDVRGMEVQLAALVEKRNMMRTRQSRAEAVQSVQGCGESMGCDLEDVFDRWETSVLEKELGAQCSISTDDFEESFVGAEEEEQLRDELRQLKEGLGPSTV
jgi:phage shock protein A